MHLAPLPASASWTHTGVRTGYEVLFPSTHHLRGHTCATEDGATWSVGYDITVDPRWRTLRTQATASSATGQTTVLLEQPTPGQWLVDGASRPDLDGCVDVDFESSAVTNTLPVHRLTFTPGNPVDAPAVFVRADLRIQRLEQRYTLLTPGVFHYESATFDFECRLTFDAAGLTLDYPGIATRTT
jgi:hypothetical protein